MTKSTKVLVFGGLAVAGALSLYALLKKDPKEPAPPLTVSLANGAKWQHFGDSTLTAGSRGFTLTNLGGSTNFASAAFNFQELQGQPLDISSQVYLHLVVKGLNGAKKLGITAVKTGEDPNLIDKLEFSRFFDISDGLQHELVFALPKNTKGLAQIALHIGQNFGSLVVLGNPPGASVQVLDAFVTTDLQLMSTVTTSQVVSSTITAPQTVAAFSVPAGIPAIVSPTATGSSVGYLPVFPSGNAMDVSALVATQERLAAASASPNALQAQALVQDAASKDHTLNAVP